MPRTRLILLAATALWGANGFSAAQAAEIALASNTHSPLITIDGNIEPGDEAKFRAIADKVGKATVLLYGNGGKTAEAIEIGRTIKAKGMGTAVANGFDCADACGLIWLAGSPRFLSKTSRVGIPSNVDRKSADPVASYVTMLNLPEKTQAFTTTVDAKSTAWVTTENASEAGIEVSPLGPAAAPAATAPQPAAATPASAAAASPVPSKPAPAVSSAPTSGVPATPPKTVASAPVTAAAAAPAPKPTAAAATPVATTAAPPRAAAAAQIPAAAAAKPTAAAASSVAAVLPAPVAAVAPAKPAAVTASPVASASPAPVAAVAQAKPAAAAPAASAAVSAKPTAVAPPAASAASAVAPSKPAVAAPAVVPAATAAATSKPLVGDAPFATAGAWEIRRGDPTVGGGCYAMTSYDPDIVLIVGYDLAQKAVFLNVGSARLQPVDPSKSYAMQVRFDNHKPWDSRAEVGLSNKVKFMMMTFRAGEFMNEFMNANGLTLREPGKDDDADVLRLNLPRSGAAAREILRCQGGANPLAVSGDVASAKPASTSKSREGSASSNR